MIKPLKNKAFSLIHAVVNIVYPSVCIGCKKTETPLCNNCLLHTEKATYSPNDFIYPLFSYNDLIIKKAIWAFKLEGKRALVLPFAQTLYDLMIEILADEAEINNFVEPILVAIPGSTAHNKRRGYDQGKVLCNELTRLDQGNFFSYHKNILVRDRKSKPQTDILNKHKRLQNIKGAYTVNTTKLREIRKRNIILIDDVTTTGATLREIRKVLKKAGARRVLAFVVAH